MMAVDYTGYYDNFCIYCQGSGVVEDFDGNLLDCSACDGRGQWDDPDWGFMPYNSRSEFVQCVLCGAHGLGLATHNRDGERLTPIYEWLLSSSPWQRTCMQEHRYFCACGKVFPKLQSLGAHVAGNRRWRNPGHGSMERVGYPAHV